MTTQSIFVLQFVLSLTVFSLVTRWGVAPWCCGATTPGLRFRLVHTDIFRAATPRVSLHDHCAIAKAWEERK